MSDEARIRILFLAASPAGAAALALDEEARGAPLLRTGAWVSQAAALAGPEAGAPPDYSRSANCGKASAAGRMSTPDS